MSPQSGLKRILCSHSVMRKIIDEILETALHQRIMQAFNRDPAL